MKGPGGRGVGGSGVKGDMGLWRENARCGTVFIGVVGTGWIVGGTKIEGGGGDAIMTSGSLRGDTGGGKLPGLGFFGDAGMVARRSRCGEGSDGAEGNDGTLRARVYDDCVAVLPAVERLLLTPVVVVTGGADITWFSSTASSLASLIDTAWNGESLASCRLLLYSLPPPSPSPSLFIIRGDKRISSSDSDVLGGSIAGLW